MITIIKELDNSEYAIYSFGPTIDICEQYPERYERWRFKILKDKVTVEECGGMENFKNIDLPDQISFII
ncbi:hypothetical protein [Bacillus arachidis]|uniref:hypothetical protein n=1 Tax=Bacillus arachidis TaxID=2819290 RepID=UPI001FB6FCB8